MTTATTLRRFQDHKPHGDPLTLAINHPALVEGRTLFRKRVVQARRSARLLKSGHNNRKIGATVQKGRWKGFPIFTLTLEERATCSRACLHWRDCYGNKMNWSERVIHGDALERRLEKELAALNRSRPKGFVVRLHVLGDFYSVDYVGLWLKWLEKFPALHVFGYSHWPADTPIGSAIRRARDAHWPRFAVRSSNCDDETRGADSYRVKGAPKAINGAIVCPAQTGRSDCCATCTLCWSTDKNVAFLVH